jgi:hypothetical protein
MPKYLILFSTKNFLTYTENTFTFGAADMNFRFRQITDEEDKSLSGLDIGWLIEAEINEKDINTAIAKAGEVLEFLLSICCLETGLPVNRTRLILIYDISENIEERIFRQYFWDLPLSIQGAEVESESFLSNIKKIYKFIYGSKTLKYKHRIYRAIRWFRKGLTTSDPLDQFLFLWHGLESLNSPLADYYGKEKKMMKKIDKKCPSCGEEYSIFIDGGIEALYNDMKIDKKERKEIKDIRNGISHGFEDNIPLADRALKLLPLLAKILYTGISNITGFNTDTKTLKNIKSIDAFKINDFIYLEGIIKEKNLLKIGLGGYYPHFELEIKDNTITPCPFLGCNFASKEIFGIGNFEIKEINEIGSFSIKIKI